MDLRWNPSSSLQLNDHTQVINFSKPWDPHLRDGIKGSCTHYIVPEPVNVWKELATVGHHRCLINGSCCYSVIIIINIKVMYKPLFNGSVHCYPWDKIFFLFSLTSAGSFLLAFLDSISSLNTATDVALIWVLLVYMCSLFEIVLGLWALLEPPW